MRDELDIAEKLIALVLLKTNFNYTRASGILLLAKLAIDRGLNVAKFETREGREELARVIYDAVMDFPPSMVEVKN